MKSPVRVDAKTKSSGYEKEKGERNLLGGGPESKIH